MAAWQYFQLAHLPLNDARLAFLRLRHQGSSLRFPLRVQEITADLGDHQLLINKQQQNHYLRSPRGCQVFLIVTYSWWAGASIICSSVNKNVRDLLYSQILSYSNCYNILSWIRNGAIHEIVQRDVLCVSGQLVSCQIRLPRASRTQLAELQRLFCLSMLAEFGGLVPQKLQQFAAMFPLVGSLKPHEHLITRGYLGLSVWSGDAKLATQVGWGAWQQGDCSCRVGQVGPHVMPGLWCSVKRRSMCQKRISD